MEIKIADVKMEIKLGDKFLCKTDYYNDVDLNLPSMNVGNWYEVVKIDHFDLPGNMTPQAIKYAQFNDGTSVYNFSLVITDKVLSCCKDGQHIWDFFYTPQELRKEKLKEIGKK